MQKWLLTSGHMEMRALAWFQAFTGAKLLPARGSWACFLLVPEADDLMIFLPLFVLAPGPLDSSSLALESPWHLNCSGSFSKWPHVPGPILPQGICVLSPSFQDLYSSTYRLTEMTWVSFSCLALLFTLLTMPGLSCQGALYPNNVVSLFRELCSSALIPWNVLPAWFTFPPLPGYHMDSLWLLPLFPGIFDI